MFSVFFCVCVCERACVRVCVCVKIRELDIGSSKQLVGGEPEQTVKVSQRPSSDETWQPILANRSPAYVYDHVIDTSANKEIAAAH